MLHECGTEMDGVEVDSNWSTSSDYDAFAIKGNILALDTSPKTTITANYGSETDSVDIITIPNVENTKFKFLDMAVGQSTRYTLEFLVRGVKQDNRTLHFYNSNPEIVSVDVNGNVVPKKSGNAIISVHVDGEKYGHLVKVLTKKKYEQYLKKQDSLKS